MCKRRLLGAVLLLLAFLVASCRLNDLPEAEPTAPEDAVVLSRCFFPGYGVIEGRVRSGARFKLYRPENWNGRLILVARGYDHPDQTPRLPDEGDESVLVDGLLKYKVEMEGYGLAFSSYSENGWAVRDGIWRTRQLIPIYSFFFGRPQETYVIGISMGGLIGVALAERYPYLIDGVLSVCGPVGGGALQFEHIINTRALFDYFFDRAYGGMMPGGEVIPGDAYHVPDGVEWDALEEPLQNLIGYDIAMSGDSQAFRIAATDQVSIRLPEPFDYSLAHISELVEMIMTPLWFSVNGSEDILSRTRGGYPVGNSGTTYTGLPPGELDALNEGVDRFEVSRYGASYLRRWYEPTGRIRVPVVTLHNTRDPAVPALHEEVFAEKVKSAHRSRLLTQEYADSFGHCNVEAEFLPALDKLLPPLPGK